MTEVVVNREMSLAGRFYGYELSVRRGSHAWACGELTAADLRLIRDKITQFLDGEADKHDTP